MSNAAKTPGGASAIANRMRQVAAGGSTTTAVSQPDDVELSAPAMPLPSDAGTQVNAKPARVRYTLDLSPEQHTFLKRFAFDANVDASGVVRVLLSRLEREPGFAIDVRKEARDDRARSKGR